VSGQNEGFHDEAEWLVGAALKKLEKPYSPSVIEDVFVTIEQWPNLLKNYEQLRGVRSQATVNQAIGHLTRVLTGYGVGKQAPATRSGLVKNYTVLVPSR
jgi:hypothetical protein